MVLQALPRAANAISADNLDLAAEHLGPLARLSLGYGQLPGTILLALTEHSEASSASPAMEVTELVLGLSRAESGQWVAIDRLVGQYGEGATCAEAVQDLVVTLRESRDLLRERREQLSKVMARQLAVLEAIPDEML